MAYLAAVTHDPVEAMGTIAAAVLALTLATHPAGLPAAPPPDSVRQLDVLIVLYPRSFARQLAPVEVERLQEEIVAFADFYRRHGGDRVSFRYSFLELDRQLRRSDVGVVQPGRYYLSREDLEPELQALGMADHHFDEVIAFYAWSNANPDGASLAFGGAAVGPDGKFLGDAGYNSIGVFAWDPGRIAQIAIHEMLHNLDDMFSRSGMADGFLNADEMSRNMALLLHEHPGAFNPFYSDREMLAFAERERAGKEMYPWWMQRIYYAWMLERTPAVAWRRLHYGRLATPPTPLALRPLYDTVYISPATSRLYFPALAQPGQTAPLPEVEVRAAREATTLTPHRYALQDFDGTPLVEQPYLAGWMDLREVGRTALLTFASAPGSSAPPPTTIRRVASGEIEAPVQVLSYRAPGERAPVLTVQLHDAGWPQPGPLLENARVTATRPDGRVITLVQTTPGSYRAAVPGDVQGTETWRVEAVFPGYSIAPAQVSLRRILPWHIATPGTRETNTDVPLNLRVGILTQRGLTANVVARVGHQQLPLERLPDGTYTVNITGLRPGLHPVELVATRPAGAGTVVDTVWAYARPAGWIRVPSRIAATPGDDVNLEAYVHSLMGRDLSGMDFPLVAVVGERAVPLREEGTSGRYRARLPALGVDRVFVNSLEGDFQRRVVIVDHAEAARRAPPLPEASPPNPALPGADGPLVYLTAPHFNRPPRIDADLREWHGPAARVDSSVYLLTDPHDYRGNDDLSARIWLAWDDSALYVAGRVRDDRVTGGEAWDRDRINLVFDWRENDTPLTYGGTPPPTARWQTDDYWILLQPFGEAGAPGQVRLLNSSGQRVIDTARLAARHNSTGYTFELRLPADALPEYAPFTGYVAAFQLFVTDGDGQEPTTELMWGNRWNYSVDGGLAWELWRMGRLVFTDTPNH